MSATLFRDVMIFDGSGDALFSGEVMVRSETIEPVARGDERIDSAGAEVIDGGD
jgi:N-acyl-D-aspartate/D-glutamate deacylase